MAKTSLILNDNIFRAAQKQALKENKTLSEIINFWAKEGLNFLKNKKQLKSKTRKLKFKTANLGKSKVDLSQRENWTDLVYDRS